MQVDIGSLVHLVGPLDDVVSSPDRDYKADGLKGCNFDLRRCLVNKEEARV